MPLYHQASTCDRNPVVFEQITHEIARAVGLLLQESMHRAIAKIENAGMLNLVSARIEKLCTDRTNV
ncbi:hypothetical protein D9M68_649130 [compost metagenome]